MKPVRLPAAATLALPRWALFALGLLYILPGLIGRDPWKADAASFGVMWTMAQGSLADWLYPNVAGLPFHDEGPLAFWLGALCIKLFGWLLGDVHAARVASLGFFLGGTVSVWCTAFYLGRRAEVQPLRLAFGGQPEPDDYGRTLADTAVLIYLGSLGLLLHSHETNSVALQVSLVAFYLYRVVRYVDAPSLGHAALLGVALGALTLSRDLVPAVLLILALLLASQYLRLAPVRTARDVGVTILAAAAVVGLWVVPSLLLRPYGRGVEDAWLGALSGQLGLPGWAALKLYVRAGIWFFWPAWPFALWCAWAWRRQRHLLHIVLPLAAVLALSALAICDPEPEQSSLSLLLPPLAVMAAFGLPTMKRSTINAIDWFSVLVLSMLAGVIWLFYMGTMTGWPAQFAKNVLKLVPGFHPQFGMLAFAVAVIATVGWFLLVHWRISRRPPVLWRAVVLSSGGLILVWVLLMTLFLPEINYSRSYAQVAVQIAARLPADTDCLESNVGPAQRASFAYFGPLPFAGVNREHCNILLLQDSVKIRDEHENLMGHAPRDWRLIWEGRRPSDRDERFRLYRRVGG
ncbi:glycosyltransferase family 39 protein [Massilia sp. TS11]|uniref:ArnT family glycosyltransferase n=1 Tax=Massilia sp. TS11 TaxID=2908003 RepID=UPI001EDC2549|nr:glycosyltransferase [Massilia sp. TS11]MCG2586303.1 glycosyltransferase [Massilia sp. TS11]